MIYNAACNPGFDNPCFDATTGACRSN